MRPPETLTLQTCPAEIKQSLKIIRKQNRGTQKSSYKVAVILRKVPISKSGNSVMAICGKQYCAFEKRSSAWLRGTLDCMEECTEETTTFYKFGNMQNSSYGLSTALKDDKPTIIRQIHAGLFGSLINRNFISLM